MEVEAAEEVVGSSLFPLHFLVVHFVAPRHSFLAVRHVSLVAFCSKDNKVNMDLYSSNVMIASIRFIKCTILLNIRSKIKKSNNIAKKHHMS